jgi:hypothetical protein
VFRIEEGKNGPQIKEERKSEEISCFELPNILFAGLEASPVA